MTLKESKGARRQAWTAEKVLEAIQLRYQQDQELYPGVLQMDDASLLSAGRRYFGSWPRALKAADVPAIRRLPSPRRPRGHWTAERLIEEIRRHGEQGHPLYSYAMQRRDNCLVSAATYHFGSWAKALAAAGFDADAVRATGHNSRQAVVNTIHRLLQKYDDIDHAKAARAYYSLCRGAEKFFGSWQDAVSFVKLTAVAPNTEYEP